MPKVVSRWPDKTSGDKMSGDKTSVDKTSVGTKRLWGQNFCGDKTYYYYYYKTSVATKRPSDKTSVGTKRLSDKTSGRQNVCEDKTSVGIKRLWTKHPSGSYLPGPCLAKFFTEKNLLSVKEEKSTNTHTLSLWEVGGKHVQYLTTQRGPLYLSRNSLHPYHVTLLKCTILHFFRLG